MGAIYCKEIRAYFHSITGYIFIAVLTALTGLFHYVYNYSSGRASFRYPLDGVLTLFVLLLPLITMRIMAEENRQKTEQLLYTSPVSIPKIVIGKYLSMATLLGICCVYFMVQPVILSRYGNVNLASDYITLLGFFLIGLSYLALGMFISSMTESQVLSAIATFFVILLTVLMPAIISLFETDAGTAWMVFAVVLFVFAVVLWIRMRNIVVSVIFLLVTEMGLAVLYIQNSAVLEGSIEKVFGWLAVTSHFDNFYYGLLSLSDIVYYLSFITIFVFLTIQSALKRRWN